MHLDEFQKAVVFKDIQQDYHYVGMTNIMNDNKTKIFVNTVFQNNNETGKIVFAGFREMEIGPPAEFGGDDKAMNPEELFVGAVNGCLMNTFKYFIRKYKIDISSYHSNAQGRLEKLSDGFRFTTVQVNAKVTLPKGSDPEKVKQIGQLAEKYCLISRSLTCSVKYMLEIEQSL